jgi:hypothetical protein
MNQNFNTELRLENADRDDHFLIFRPDESGDLEDLVCLNIIHKNKTIDLCNEEATDDYVGYFHLDKFQVGCLVNYLNSLHSIME